MVSPVMSLPVKDFPAISPATEDKAPQIPFPLPVLEKTNPRDLLLEGVKEALGNLEAKQQAFLSAGNKAFAAVMAQRITFWKEVQQQAADESNPCGTEQLQIFSNLVQEDGVLLETPVEMLIPQFILGNLSRFYVSELTKKAMMIQLLLEGDKERQTLLEPHLEAMLKPFLANDPKGVARCWKELLEALLPKEESLEEPARAQLKVLAIDLPLLQKLFALESFDPDVFSLIYVRNYIRDAQILLTAIKPDSKEHDALLPVLAQMQQYLQQGNPLGVAMLWNNFLETESEMFLGQERDQEALHAIQFVYRNSTPLRGMLDLIAPGLISEFTSEHVNSLVEELLTITDDIAANHPEFNQRLGQWLGSHSADNCLYAALVEQGKRGVIQHPEKIAVWVRDLSTLIKKGFDSVPEQYSKVLEEAQRIADLIAKQR